MLAYELYLKNEGYEGSIWPSFFPIKKIFYSRGKFEVDKKTLEHYGGAKNEKFAALQEWISMPLNTADANLLNLPYKVSGANSRRPYIVINGTYESTETKNPTIKIGISHKDGNEFSASMDIKTLDIKITASGKIPTKLDKQNYFISKKTLFDEYVQSGIIGNDESFSSDKFKSLAKTFFEFVKSREFGDFKTKPIRFVLVILPSGLKD